MTLIVFFDKQIEAVDKENRIEALDKGDCTTPIF